MKILVTWDRNDRKWYVSQTDDYFNYSSIIDEFEDKDEIIDFINRTLLENIDCNEEFITGIYKETYSKEKGYKYKEIEGTIAVWDDYLKFKQYQESVNDYLASGKLQEAKETIDKMSNVVASLNGHKIQLAK